MPALGSDDADAADSVSTRSVRVGKASCTPNFLGYVLYLQEYYLHALSNSVGDISNIQYGTALDIETAVRKFIEADLNVGLVSGRMIGEELSDPRRKTPPIAPGKCRKSVPDKKTLAPH